MKCTTCPTMDETLALRMLRACTSVRRTMGVSDQELKMLNDLQQTLRYGARRPFTLSGMNTPCATCDERCLLNIIAAYQNNDAQRAQNMLGWLLYPHARKDASESLARIAKLLKRQKIQLIIVNAKPPERRETPGLYPLIGS